MLYLYEAFNKSGAVVKGEVEAKDEKDVVYYLQTKDLIPSSIKAKSPVNRGLNVQMNLFQKVTDSDRIFLVRNLATAIKAGLSITEALDVLINETKNALMRDILLSVKTKVQQGGKVSDGFAAYSKYFPPVFIGLLKSGETSSQLDKTLNELSNHLAKEYALVRKVRSALVYPTLLLLASLGVVIFLIAFVLPRLAKTFALSGAQLPFITKALLWMSAVITAKPLVTIAVFALIIIFAIYLKRSNWGKRVIAATLFHTPVVRDLIRRVALVRFTRTFGSLLSGATPILDALQISSEAVGNDYYRDAIIDTQNKIREGVPLSKGFQEYPDLFPGLLISLIAVGERTGNIEYVLGTFANFYDEEVDAKLKDLTTLFEPILLLFMGLIVGTIAVSVLLPIYQLVGKFT